MTTLTEVKSYYDSCLQKFRSLEDLFEDKSAFQKALDGAQAQMPAFLLIKKRGTPTYDSRTNEMCIPAGRPAAVTKGSTYHETIHKILINYCIASNRLLAERLNFDAPAELGVSARRGEHLLHEALTIVLTDVALQEDKNALFESRYLGYSVHTNNPNAIRHMPVMIATVGSTVFFVVSTLPNKETEWYFAALPFAGFVVGNVFGYFAERRHKEKMRDKLLAMPAPKFEKRL